MVVVFKKGDDFLPKLRKWLERNRINSGFFYGFGEFSKAELAFYDLKKKKYFKKKFGGGPFEVLSLVGNAAQGEGDVIVHSHAVLADKNFKTFGGHLVGAVVAGTLELKLTQTELLERRFDDETGLNLLK